jgi:hypothetical protein
MLSIHGSKHRLCDGLVRRDFLKVGGLSVGGLTLADLLRYRAAAAPATTPRKSIIMVYLNGGPSHVDMYDLKPDAPVEYRGEFRPTRTNVPGFDICELMPRQARIADKLAIIRNMQFRQQGHTPPELYTGFVTGNRPSIGSIVSRLRGQAGIVDAMPPYVALGDANHIGGPGFLGAAHRPYLPGMRGGELGLTRGVTVDQLAERRTLRAEFDSLRRDLDDSRGTLAGLDAFTSQALEMIVSNRARDAFDLTKEPSRIRERYGRGTEYLLARRLVEAGVPVVTLTPRNHNPGPMCNGEWDHHDHIFRCLRGVLPQLDQSIHALVTDLDERGLADDVGVVVWGEMGRTPRVGTQRGTTATDARGERPRGRPYTPQNVLATLYHVLGIDPATTIPDHQGRPIYLLDDREKIAELV